MTFNKRNPNKFFFLPMLLLAFLNSIDSSAQKRIYLEAADSFNGELVKVEWRAESRKTGHSYVIKTEDKRQYFDINKEDEVQLKTINDFYYVEEKLLLEPDVSDGDEVKVSVEKRPTATLHIAAVDILSSRNEPAAFEVFFEGRMIGRGNTTRNAPRYDLIVKQAGSYQIKTNAAGFSESTEMIEVQIGNPSNQIEKMISLAKPGNEVAVRFTDEQTGSLVSTNVTIKETASGKIVYDKVSPNGVVLFTFKNGINYEIKGTSENYREYNKTIEGAQREDLKAIMRPYAYIEFIIIDSYTKKPIPAFIKMVSPSGVSKSFVYKTGEKIRPDETGNYKVEIQSDGYVPSSGTVGVASLYGSSVQPSYSLVEADKQFYIQVIDHYSKKQVTEAIFRVFGPGGEEVPGVKKDDKGIWYFITDPEKSYFIETGGLGYQNVTKALKEDNKRFDIELYWTPEVTHSYTLLERFTNKPVSNADLKIITEKGEELFVYNTKKDGVFLTKMNQKRNVNYSITAEGYQSDVVPKVLTSNSQELYLTAVGVEQYELNIIDFLSKEVLNANVRYFLGEQEMTLIGAASEGNKKIYYGPGKPYALEVRLKDYSPFIGQIKPDMVKGKVVEVMLKKDKYPVKFKIENIEDNAELRNLTFRINADKGDRIPEKFSAKEKLYEADLILETQYSLELIKDGYERYSETFFLKDLANSNYIKSIKLIKLPAPIKEEVKVAAVIPEPVKEIPKPKVEEQKTVVVSVAKEEPVAIKKPEVVKEKPAFELPSSVNQMASEFSKKESLGKRYLLEQVFFDQGSSKIRDSEVKQLNELAQSLKENKELIIEIVGYTDNVGDPRLNLGLSEFRAKAVANYLFFKGADPDRIQSKGFGQEKSVADNDTEENRAKNRRVEMVLIEN